MTPTAAEMAGSIEAVALTARLRLTRLIDAKPPSPTCALSLNGTSPPFGGTDGHALQAPARPCLGSSRATPGNHARHREEEA